MNQDLFVSELSVLPSVENLTIEKGKFLFKEGKAMQHIYFLIEGELTVFRANQVVWKVHKNEFVGLTSFFSKENFYAYHVKSNIKSRVLKIPLEQFTELINERSELHDMLVKTFNKRINSTLTQTHIRTKYTRKKRLIHYLIEYARSSEKSKKLTLHLSIKDLADTLHTSSSFVKTTLENLQQKGFIYFNKENVEIIDYKGLKLVLSMNDNLL